MDITPDNEFIKNSNVPGPTKEEVRCLVMCKSQVSKADVVVDVGCGTGGLTLEFAKRAKKVYAIDKNPEALKTTFKNLQKHGLDDGVDLIEADGTEVLDNLPPFDVLMVGGSGGKMDYLLKRGYKKLKSGGRIVVTSILLETPSEATMVMKDLGMEVDVVGVSISKGKISARGTMMVARNPITIVSAKKALKN
ncbi:precorrin-6Y C5,15-methyltransferase (decarboxylating) subunit CbiT [Methanobacterium congolense]|uniref:Probable cobalt-precorrin-6B C(15)-methyltransferase (decarboxylating) n=1 Tax=Methanobacterium congolense TaxID=118062 RepID=A0A1D3L2B5_9EURY|nr:putative cobalt-precorrin-6B C(15)-methyltransferase (decarboxylating) [Methanobacterium congolense]